MHLVLTLPGLLARTDESTGAPRMPALARLIAGAERPRREPEGLVAALAPQYGIERQRDWPFAPLRLAAMGFDPGSAYWLAADPVTLVAGRDDVRPAGAIADLTPAEVDRLIATLNRHFAADGLVFVAPRPDSWFVRAPTAPQMVTHTLDTAAGRPLRALLPEGPDAGSWRRWLSEIQMLLHEHPVNVGREGRGCASVNSVWFSGGGTLPSRPTLTARVRTWANSGIATAFAMHVGMPARPLPANLADALAGAGQGERHVVILDAPLDLVMVENLWAAPTWRALTAGELATATLIADGAGDAIVWTAQRPGGWQRIARRFAAPDLEVLFDAVRPSR